MTFDRIFDSKYLYSLCLSLIFLGLAQAAQATECDFGTRLSHFAEPGLNLKPAQLTTAIDLKVKDASLKIEKGAWLLVAFEQNDKSCAISNQGNTLLSSWVSTAALSPVPWTYIANDWVGKWQYESGNTHSTLQFWRYHDFLQFYNDPNESEIDAEWLGEFPDDANTRETTPDTLGFMGSTGVSYTAPDGEESANVGYQFDIADFNGPLYIYAGGPRTDQSRWEGPCLIIVLHYQNNLAVASEGICGGNGTSFNGTYTRSFR